MTPPAGGGAALPSRAATRGRLRIADRVYARIAAAAAREALATAWVGRAATGKPPTVSVHVPGSTVTVRVGVELPFPADLGALARGVRERVAAQVLELTGTRVSEVVVVVEKLIARGAS
ncbi:Asp23/Gls24 family envelope stress response protein [Streptomyces sp. NRRL WC-3742]|uniref:Asp23/Gls24 family envelope stress response protein n=1 Tax=Streptomyces sp. NRRL WC-3742 TaxID=1463934 RepID=UPI0004C8BAED|nr:Asp23/Gls24 family envelope stress response protein [Streptomyces sp. NRRL WC-3742]